MNYQQSYAFVEKQLLTGSTTVLALEQARGMIEAADIAKRQPAPITPCSYQHLPDSASSAVDLQA